MLVPSSKTPQPFGLRVLWMFLHETYRRPSYSKKLYPVMAELLLLMDPEFPGEESYNGYSPVFDSDNGLSFVYKEDSGATAPDSVPVMDDAVAALAFELSVRDSFLRRSDTQREMIFAAIAKDPHVKRAATIQARSPIPLDANCPANGFDRLSTAWTRGNLHLAFHGDESIITTISRMPAQFRYEAVAAAYIHFAHTAKGLGENELGIGYYSFCLQVAPELSQEVIKEQMNSVPLVPLNVSTTEWLLFLNQSSLKLASTTK